MARLIMRGNIFRAAMTFPSNSSNDFFLATIKVTDLNPLN